jgi:hypothetical protein
VRIAAVNLTMRRVICVGVDEDGSRVSSSFGVAFACFCPFLLRSTSSRRLRNASMPEPEVGEEESGASDGDVDAADRLLPGPPFLSSAMMKG